MVQKVRDTIRELRRRADRDGEPYVPSQLPINLTQAQFDEFLADDYLAYLHTPEGIALISSNKQYLGHPLNITEN